LGRGFHGLGGRGWERCGEAGYGEGFTAGHGGVRQGKVRLDLVWVLRRGGARCGSARSVLAKYGKARDSWRDSARGGMVVSGQVWLGVAW
jgi:hypothetical protein